MAIQPFKIYSLVDSLESVYLCDVSIFLMRTVFWVESIQNGLFVAFRFELCDY